MIYWISGNTKAGKTTLAGMLANNFRSNGDPCIILDADEVRLALPGLGLSREDRHENGMRIARLAKMFAYQGFEVIVACIAPYYETRAEIDKLCQPHWIYLPGGHITDKEHPYEPGWLYIARRQYE